jgi:hypothetical protein
MHAADAAASLQLHFLSCLRPNRDWPRTKLTSATSKRDLAVAQVWEAVSELRVTGNWVVTGIPRLFYAFEVTLAAGQPHELAPLALPTAPPGVPPGATPAEVRVSAGGGIVLFCCLKFDLLSASSHALSADSGVCTSSEGQIKPAVGKQSCTFG